MPCRELSLVVGIPCPYAQGGITGSIGQGGVTGIILRPLVGVSSA